MSNVFLMGMDCFQAVRSYFRIKRQFNFIQFQAIHVKFYQNFVC